MGSDLHRFILTPQLGLEIVIGVHARRTPVSISGGVHLQHASRTLPLDTFAKRTLCSPPLGLRRIELREFLSLIHDNSTVYMNIFNFRG